MIVRSDPQTGQRSWYTLLDGKPIDSGFGWTSSDPGLMTLGRSETITRFGWWGAGDTGSPLKVGEYQGLGTSPFWDIDTIRSNGRGTVDLWGSQLNSEAWDVRSHFYQNGFTGDINFEQFPHLLENSPPGGGSRQSTDPVVTDNLSVGQDSAVRVQQLKVAFKGPLTKNIQWKFQFWMFRKFGEHAGQLDGPLLQHQPGRGARGQPVPRRQPAATASTGRRWKSSRAWSPSSTR